MMRNKCLIRRCLLLAACLFVSVFLSACGAQQEKEALAEGLQYLRKEGTKDAAEVQKKLRERKEAWEKADDVSYIPESSGDDPEQTGPGEQDVTEPAPGTQENSETLPDETDPAGTSSDSPDTEPQGSETVPEEPQTEPLPADPYQDLRQQIETLNIAPLSEGELAQLRNRFDNTVFIGDSLTQAMLTYGFFDENHIKYRRSASIEDLGPEIDAALAMLPDNIVFFTGLNDVSRFITDPTQYYEAYKEKILGIISARPDVHIYVLSLLPPSNDLAKVNLNLARSPEFDEQLKRAAADTPAVYLDCHWMVRQQLYLDDGIHFKESFYVVLLKYLSGEIYGVH